MDDRSEDLFMRSQDLLVPDDMQGDSSQYTPGSALRDADASMGEDGRSRLVAPRTRDHGANLFLRSQDLLEPDDLEMDSKGYTPGSAMHRSMTSLSDGWRGRLSSLKERGLERMDSVRGGVFDRFSTMRDGMSERMSTMRDGMTERMSTAREEVGGRVSEVSREMREHPMKWAAVAAAAGVGLGFAGRMLMRMRTRVQREMPSLVIIETC